MRKIRVISRDSDKTYSALIIYKTTVQARTEEEAKDALEYGLAKGYVQLSNCRVVIQ